MDRHTRQEAEAQRTKDYSDEIILADETGKLFFVHEQVKKRFGLKDNCMGSITLENIIPDINLKETEEGVVIQKYAKHLDGKTFPLFIKVNSFFLSEQLYYFLTLYNVKDRTKLEKELSEPLNELMDLKFALDESTIVAITDNKGTIKYVNDKFCQVSKYSAGELIGRDHYIINSGYHSKEFMRNLWRTISSGKVWRGEIKNKAKDGSYYWVDTTIVPFLNETNKPYQYLAIRQEITEHKKVVEDLERSVQDLMDLKFALDESSIVAITDARGKINYVNDKFCQISKYTKEELLGRDHRIINSGYHPKEFFKEMWETISFGEVWQGEIKNKAKDGTNYWVDTTIVPFLNEVGRPYQYLAIRYEITNRKRVEAELQRMMTKLIDVQEEERKTLSRNLHDGIGQNLYSHLITINRLQAELQHPLLDQMQEEATQLIQEVREISWELRPSVLDDLGLIPAIRSFLTRYSEYYDIDVVFDCVLKGRLNNNAEITIYRVIQEALTNVRKYAEVKDASVVIRGQEDRVRVVIEDRGKGFQIDHTSSSGVGLFSMEERAISVGGTLNIHTTRGQGTKVVLDVPYVSEN